METPRPQTSSTVGNEAADSTPDVATQEVTLIIMIIIIIITIGLIINRFV